MTTPAPSVRSATQDDLPELTELFQGYLEFYGRSHAPEQISAFLAERLKCGESTVLVARLDDGPLIGFVQCYPTWSSLALAPAWVLNDLFIAPAGRGSGAGRALVSAARKAAREAGAAYIALETASDNTPARRLYESEGFTVDDEFLHYARTS